MCKLKRVCVIWRWSVQVEGGLYKGKKEGIKKVKENKEKEETKKVKDCEGEGLRRIKKNKGKRYIWHLCVVWEERMLEWLKKGSRSRKELRRKLSI